MSIEISLLEDMVKGLLILSEIVNAHGRLIIIVCLSFAVTNQYSHLMQRIAKV